MLVSLRPTSSCGNIWNRNDRHAEIPEGAGRLLEGPERLSAHNARFKHERIIERSVEANEHLGVPNLLIQRRWAFR